MKHKRKRESELEAIAMGLLTAVVGVHKAFSAMAEIGADMDEVRSTRRQHQHKEDEQQIEQAIQILQDFMNAQKQTVCAGKDSSGDGLLVGLSAATAGNPVE